MPNFLTTLRTSHPRKVLLHGLLPLAVLVMSGCTEPNVNQWVGSYTLETVGGAALPITLYEARTDGRVHRRLINSARIDIWNGSTGEGEFGIGETYITEEEGQPHVREYHNWSESARFSESEGLLLMTHGPYLGMRPVTDTIVPSAGTLRIRGFRGLADSAEWVFSRR